MGGQDDPAGFDDMGAAGYDEYRAARDRFFEALRVDWEVLKREELLAAPERLAREEG